MTTKYPCATHTPAAPATESKFTCWRGDCKLHDDCIHSYGQEYPPCVDACAMQARKAEREQVLDILEEFLNSDDHLSLFKWEVREQIRSPWRCPMKSTYRWKGTIGRTNTHSSTEAQRRKRLRRAGLLPPLEFTTIDDAIRQAGL